MLPVTSGISVQGKPSSKDDGTSLRAKRPYSAKDAGARRAGLKQAKPSKGSLGLGSALFRAASPTRGLPQGTPFSHTASLLRTSWV